MAFRKYLTDIYLYNCVLLLGRRSSIYDALERERAGSLADLICFTHEINALKKIEEKGMTFDHEFCY